MPGGIQGRIQADLESMFQAAKERLEESRARNTAEAKRLVKLGAGYFWDPVKKQVVKKVGSTFQFVRHDRRQLDRGTSSRRYVEVAGGLYWDRIERKLFVKQGERWIFYSPDRRKRQGQSPTGRERRAQS